MGNKKTFGSLLKNSRKALLLTTVELARKTGIDRTYITKIERENMLPSPLVMKRITDVLKDAELFETYLKIKYPPLYEQFRKEDMDLAAETNKIADDIAAQKNKTPEGEEEFIKRVTNVIIKTRQSIAKFKKILVKLENIEKAHLKSKNTRQSKDRSKV